MSMGVHDKLRMFAGGLLLAFMAAFALAAAAAPSTEPATQTPAASTSEHPDFGKASLPHGEVPEHAATCFEQHHPCSPGGIAPAPAASVAADAMPGMGLVKAPALLPVPMPDVAPHAAVSLTILFRNFRE
jgi:hypothetical protein